jgi:hypothetical protein
MRGTYSDVCIDKEIVNFGSEFVYIFIIVSGLLRCHYQGAYSKGGKVVVRYL